MGLTTFSGLQSKGDSSEPGFVVLQTAADVQYYLWVDSTGDLRISAANTKPTSYDADGTVVGTQS